MTKKPNKRILPEINIKEEEFRRRHSGEGNEIFPANMAKNKEGRCIFAAAGQCPNADYCNVEEDREYFPIEDDTGLKGIEFRCIMRERFIYGNMIADIRENFPYYPNRTRR
jgi:hypothetical protein